MAVICGRDVQAQNAVLMTSTPSAKPPNCGKSSAPWSASRFLRDGWDESPPAKSSAPRPRRAGGPAVVGPLAWLLANRLPTSRGKRERWLDWRPRVAVGRRGAVGGGYRHGDDGHVVRHLLGVYKRTVFVVINGSHAGDVRAVPRGRHRSPPTPSACDSPLQLDVLAVVADPPLPVQARIEADLPDRCDSPRFNAADARLARRSLALIGPSQGVVLSAEDSAGNLRDERRAPSCAQAVADSSRPRAFNIRHVASVAMTAKGFLCELGEMLSWASTSSQLLVATVTARFQAVWQSTALNHRRRGLESRALTSYYIRGVRSDMRRPDTSGAFNHAQFLGIHQFHGSRGSILHRRYKLDNEPNFIL